MMLLLRPTITACPAVIMVLHGNMCMNSCTHSLGYECHLSSGNSDHQVAVSVCAKYSTSPEVLACMVK